MSPGPAQNQALKKKQDVSVALRTIRVYPLCGAARESSERLKPQPANRTKEPLVDDASQ
jgi:hypothetical protein